MNIHEKKIKRLNLLQRSIDKAYKQLKNVLYSNAEDEIFMALKSLLDLIFSADEMHFDQRYHEIKDNDSNGKYLNGLRYAANSLKHERICFEVHQLTTTPMFSFPLEIPEEGIEMGRIEAVWIKIDALPNRKLDNAPNLIKQKRIYDEHLVGNEIFQAIDKGIEFLERKKVRVEEKY